MPKIFGISNKEIYCDFCSVVTEDLANNSEYNDYYQAKRELQKLQDELSEANAEDFKGDAGMTKVVAFAGQ